MQFRPGVAPSSFIDDCTKEMNQCILKELGDANITINGEAVCAIFNIEAEKFEGFEDGPGQKVETITLDWLKDDAPNVRSGNPVVVNGRRYKIKKGFPMDLKDCWLTAELSDC